MSTQNLLHYQFSPNPQSLHPTLVLIHGLFGDLNNLAVIARIFSDHHPILRLDLRNHGSSFHSDEMNYTLLAEDVLRVIEHLQLTQVILIGHSMGGKTAMKIADLAPHLVKKLVVIDIAPVIYDEKWHTPVFEGLFAVKDSAATTRQQAKSLLAEYISEEAVIQFVLKSFAPQTKQKFRFNTSALFHHYHDIMAWQKVYFAQPTLFIKGALSNYIVPEYTQTIVQQFPQATSFIIAGSGHWVHAEKSNSVVRAIQNFLAKTE